MVGRNEHIVKVFFKFAHLNLCLVIQTTFLRLVLKLFDSLFALLANFMAFLFVRNFLRRRNVGFRDHVARGFPLELLI